MKDVLVILGSESDREQVDPGLKLLGEKNLTHECHIYSAHRQLNELLAFLRDREKDFRLVIACAGLAAALPGVVASQVKVPVIGVPLLAGHLSGMDALLAILQLPQGVPVATMGLGKQGILNAVLLAERIIKSPK